MMKMVPEGTLSIALHNPTEGIFKDIPRVLQEKGGKDTPIVVLTRQFMVATSEDVYKINPELLIHKRVHSEGGLIALNAYKGMTPDQQKRLQRQLCVLSLGSAASLPLECGYEVRNVYSRQDWITLWFALKHRKDPKYDIRFVPCRSSWSERTAFIADHAFLGGTYQHAQFKYIEQLREKWKFYDGK